MYGCDPVRDLSVFRRAERVSIAGYGATLRMWRDEYAADCNHSEFRAAMLVQRTASLTIAGLTVTHAGGDGMTVMGDRTPAVSKRNVCEPLLGFVRFKINSVCWWGPKGVTHGRVLYVHIDSGDYADPLPVVVVKDRVIPVAETKALGLDLTLQI
eukprot:m.469201 g.469201  ORF g.469201 m.469201 type:complete len:155 (-) comp28248_c0_seq1:583-1047(-)